MSARDFLTRLFSSKGRAQMEERLTDEMHFHIEMATRQNIASGMDADEARRAAHVAFGGHTRWQESARDEYRSRYADELLQDLRYALRGLAHSPAFTFAAVATLALSVGATTSMFSVVNAVLLRKLPYPDPSRIVVLCERNTAFPVPCNTLNPGNFLAWRDDATSFSAMAAYLETSVSLTGGGFEPVSAHASLVSASFFPILGAHATVGRFFTEDEDRPDAPRVAVLSDAFWRQQYAGDRSIVGKTISVNANPVTVVGVAAASAASFDPVDLWLPMRFSPAQRTGGGRYLHGIARLRDGVATAAAGQEMTAVMARRAREEPQTNTNWTALVTPLRESLVGNSRSVLWVLLGAVAFLLVIACANVANLLLARAADRQREVAVRISLGASPSRIVRQLLTESIVLAVGASLIGLGLALEGTHALVALVPDGMSVLANAHVSVDWRVLAFTAVVAIATGVAFGLAPAAQSARTDVQTTLRQGGRGGASDSRTSARVRSALVVAEMSLAMVLLAGAGLMVRSFSALEHVNLGFDPEQLLTARVSLPRVSYPNDTVRLAFFQAAEARLAALPGVRSVGAISYLPLSGLRSANGFNIEGRAPFPLGQEPDGDMRAVTPGYFRSMAIALKEGRALTDADVASAPAVAVVSESLAHKFWPNESAVGHYLLYTWNGDERVEIVGVAADVHHEGADKSALMEIYRPLAQFPYAEMSLVMRVNGNPATYGAAMRSAVKEVNPNVPLAELESMDELVDKSFGRSRLSTTLFGLFGVLGVVLAAIGIYGVMSYTVEQRRREIGIRMALGARPAEMVRAVVRRGAVLAGLGIVTGVIGALVLTRFMRALLFGVTPGDQTTLIVVASVLGTVGLVAAWVPGRRATRIDPVTVLRGE